MRWAVGIVLAAGLLSAGTAEARAVCENSFPQVHRASAKTGQIPNTRRVRRARVVKAAPVAPVRPALVAQPAVPPVLRVPDLASLPSFDDLEVELLEAELALDDRSRRWRVLPPRVAVSALAPPPPVLLVVRPQLAPVLSRPTQRWWVRALPKIPAGDDVSHS